MMSWTWIADCGNRCDGTGHLGSVLLRSILCCDPRPGSSCDSVVTPFARLSGLTFALGRATAGLLILAPLESMIAALCARGLGLALAAADLPAVLLVLLEAMIAGVD